MELSTRASRGCMPCRKRKIRCDQSRPHCQMCVKRSKHCYGYREEADLRFLDQTESTQRKLRQTSNVDHSKDLSTFLTRSTSASQSPDNPLIPARTRTPSENSVLVTPRSPNYLINPSISGIQLDIPSSEQSLSLFFHQYVSPGDDEIPGMNDFLPLFYQQAPASSCLKLCVAATAHASLANQSNSTALGLKAWEAYGTALSSSLKDETLSALFILGMFENISGQQLNIFGVHGCGMDRLLNVRGPQSFASTKGQLISKAVCAYLQIRNLSLGRRPPPHEEAWLAALNYRYPTPYRRFMLSVSRICHARSDAEGLLSSIEKYFGDGNDGSLQGYCSALTDIIAEMQIIEANHWSWAQDASDSWAYISVNGPNSNTALGASSDNLVHIYHSLWMANIWNWNRSSCILLQCSLLKCLEKSSVIFGRLPDHDSLEANARMTIQTMIRDICASIPFIMCDINSEGEAIISQQTTTPVGQNMAQLWLLWHFHTVLRSGHLLPQQLKLIKDTIPRIGHGKGIRQALQGRGRVAP
ncbi:hypothetical protein N431DRAFT_546040 [Stipitochalara longipes BDJ]|nr:hypothetical protein N431DRAFT_546040 [Stipitochalara longipes BDJ]